MTANASPPFLISAQIKAADVDIVFTEKRADIPDHAGNVFIFCNQHKTARNRFDTETADLGKSAFAARENSARRGLFAFVRYGDCRNVRREMFSGLFVTRRQFNAAFFGDNQSVDDVDAGRNVAQKVRLKRRVLHGRGIFSGEIIGKFEFDFRNRRIS